MLTVSKPSADSSGPGVRASDLILSPDLSPARAGAFLADLGFRDPAGADQRIQQLAERLSDRGRLAKLLSDLLGQLAGCPDPDAALLRLESFFEAAGSADGLVAFLTENEGALEAAATLFGSSLFLTQLLMRNPQYFYWLLAGRRLDEIPPSGYFLEQCRQALVFGRPQSSLESLRRLHRREYLRIAAQDLLGLADLPQILEQTSRLADAIVKTVLELLLPEFGEPGDCFAVIALGKLGGQELNFSSDIDLVYVYSDASDRRRMMRLAKRLTAVLGEITKEGRLYRVDLRLRPMGRGGEIAYPLSAYRHYWETSAETFERLALIKARAVAGDPELCQQFEQSARRFVYRKYLDQAALEEIAWLKRRSERAVEPRGAEGRNVKLGMGGIREVEFFVQSFQILYGGPDASLRSPSTLRALDRLVDAGYLETDDFHRLKDAYTFLRAVENRLQLVHDRQVQTLPEDAVELERLARQMGGRRRAPQFGKELARHQRNVRRLFEALFQPAPESRLRRLVLDARVSRESALETLRGAQIDPPGPFWDSLEQLKTAPAFPHSAAKMRNLLANLLPGLLAAAAGLEHPERLVNRFDRFCEALGSRVPLYQGLVEDPELAGRLFRLISLSSFLSDSLIRHPELLDALARGLPPPPDREGWEAMVPGGYGPATVRRAVFKRREELKIAAWELDTKECSRARRRLSHLADLCLEDACRQWMAEHPQFRVARWSLFALGKLGGCELTYHSDLDVVLIYDERDSRISPGGWNTLVRWLKRELESYSTEGPCYSLDIRLRPEGSKSSPATPLAVGRRYFQDRAQGWERLAYLKLRPVLQQGRPISASSLLRLRPLTAGELENVLHLRRRKERELARESDQRIDFKVGLGGMLDIQLAAQVAQLEVGMPEVNTQRVLKHLETLQPSPLDAGAMLAWWDFLLRLESAVRLLSERSSNSLERSGEQTRLAARLLGFPDSEDLWNHCLEQRQQVRRTFREFFGSRSQRNDQGDP